MCEEDPNRGASKEDLGHETVNEAIFNQTQVPKIKPFKLLLTKDVKLVSNSDPKSLKLYKLWIIDIIAIYLCLRESKNKKKRREKMTKWALETEYNGNAVAMRSKKLSGKRLEKRSVKL